MAEVALQGSVLAMVLFDVCEEIRLEELRALFAAQRRRPAFKHPAAEQVRVEQPPVVESLPVLLLKNGERWDAQIKYYNYGVVSILLQFPFCGSWPELVGLSSTWISGTELEQHAARIARDKLQHAASALVKPYPEWLREDYFVFLVTSAGAGVSAARVMADHGGQIAQIVRGESTELSPGEQAELLQASISYYPTDVAVIGWNAAFLYDSPAGAETTIQMLEYANSQLLEFRHYDEYLTQELADVYRLFGRHSGFLGRWRLAKAASRLNALTVEVTELTERVDNAIKFVGDMFSARLYRLAALRLGVQDYKRFVNEKLDTAQRLYGFLVEQFQQSRTFVLELMVVVILVIELVFLFRGK